MSRWADPPATAAPADQCSHGPRERCEARRRGPHHARVLDRRLDLGAVTDDRGVPQQPTDVALRHRRNPHDAEVVEHPPEPLPLTEHNRPAEPGLEHTQSERLEQCRLVVKSGSPTPHRATRSTSSSTRSPRPGGACASDKNCAPRARPSGTALLTDLTGLRRTRCRLRLWSRRAFNRQIGERLFLSHRTIGSHLYRMFRKLDHLSRAATRCPCGAHQGERLKCRLEPG